METSNLTATDWDWNGVQLLRASKYEEAIAAFTQAIEVNQYYASAYTHRAEAYRAIGQEEMADTDLATIQELVEKRRSSPGKSEGIFEDPEGFFENPNKKHMLIGGLLFNGFGLLTVYAYRIEGVSEARFWAPILALAGAIEFLWGWWERRP